MPSGFYNWRLKAANAFKFHKIYLRGVIFAAFSMFSAFILLGEESSAGVSEENIVNAAYSGANNLQKDAEKDAAKAISGSPYPGVIDHLLQRPLPEEQRKLADIHINYPSIGHKIIDADIRAWVNEIADAFEAHLDYENASLITSSQIDLDLEINKFLQDDDLHSSYLPPDVPSAVELWGNYKVTRPSDAAVSITFELWNYTNPEQSNLDILTLNYSLLTGQRLNFVDIFENPELALQLMSTWSRQKLQERLGAALRARMLQDGTEPLIENFSSLTLTPEGICINFQPYQVAPWDAGIQKVEMPLEELSPSSPLLALWGK